jgi:hypothetical protein
MGEKQGRFFQTANENEVRSNDIITDFTSSRFYTTLEVKLKIKRYRSSCDVVGNATQVVGPKKKAHRKACKRNTESFYCMRLELCPTGPMGRIMKFIKI